MSAAMHASPRDESDETLLSRVRWENDEAFGELVHRHGRYLFGIARSLLRNLPDAEDVVQETFTAVLQARFDGQSSVRTWMVGILVRQAAMLRRKRSRWMRVAENPPAPSQPSPQLAVDARLDLAEMLEHLTPEHREVIVLRELEQQSYDQIARTLNVPRGTVESRLHRAREQLRALFNVNVPRETK